MKLQQKFVLPEIRNLPVHPQLFRQFRVGDWLRLETLISYLEGYVVGVEPDAILFAPTKQDDTLIIPQPPQFELAHNRIHRVLEILYEVG